MARIILAISFLFSCTSPQKPYLSDQYPGCPDEVVANVFPEGEGIILVGDTGTGEKDQYKVAAAMQQFCYKYRCDYGLLLGDNIYPLGVKSATDPQFFSKFEKPYENLDFKFFPVLGNHDGYGKWQYQVSYRSEHWVMFGRWYKLANKYFDAFALDTNAYQIFKTEKSQVAWLGQELPKSKARWKIVYGHHPVYSGGDHGDNRELRKHLLPVLQQNRVDFYVSGHDHDKQVIERDGLTFVVSGAGAKLRSTKATKYHTFSKASLGFAHLLLTDKEAVLRFVDASGRVEYEKVYKK